MEIKSDLLSQHKIVKEIYVYYAYNNNTKLQTLV